MKRCARVVDLLSCFLVILALMVFWAHPLHAGSGIMQSSVMMQKARSKGKFCSPYWNNWLGSKSGVRSASAIAISGKDLAAYRSNADPMIGLLFSETVSAARSGNMNRLKQLLIGMAQKDHFTRLQPYKPKTWHGTVPSWLPSYNGLAEPAYSAALLLVAISQAYAVAEPSLTTAERRLIRRWGTKIFKASRNANDGSKEKAYDRRAAKAAGFVSWGAASGEKSAYRAGVAQFKSVVAHIQKDGRDDYFTVAEHHRGTELKYLNMTYGHLSVAAGVMESLGDPGFAYRRGGGSLADGLNFLISQSFNPAARTKISRKQLDMRWASRPRDVTDHSWSFMEFAAASPIVRQRVPGWKRALSLRGSSGFYGGHHGGYTSCLFGN